ALDRYASRPRADYGSFTGADTGVACLCHLGLTLWLLGYPDQAKARLSEALALAEQLKHPYSQVFALSFAAWHHQYRRESELTVHLAQQARQAATEQKFELLLPFSRIFQGWALVDQEEHETGLTHLRQGLAAYLDTGAELVQLHFLALLADAYYQIGDVEAGLKILVEAIDLAKAKGERFYEAELYRLSGELLRRQAPTRSEPHPEEAKAELNFRKAIVVAQQQQAKSLELRAAISLGRLWAGRGKVADAHGLLKSCCDWFTEGSDTPDRIIAQQLLEQWSTETTR
ncbi:MAG: hypothetical protein R3264_08260, partial [Anaerolineae bacterium]|nr:hypothetical protein [Anaerolineae bacterium]